MLVPNIISEDSRHHVETSIGAACRLGYVLVLAKSFKQGRGSMYAIYVSE
jgi:hypothetical protein